MCVFLMAMIFLPCVLLMAMQYGCQAGGGPGCIILCLDRYLPSQKRKLAWFGTISFQQFHVEYNISLYYPPGVYGLIV